ncbi:MAG: hypothetical protein V7641_2723 [Blastocatellia bacterium]
MIITNHTFRILYVEDDPSWVNLLQRHLDRINNLDFNRDFSVKCELIHALSGEEFLELLDKDSSFDLALIDLQLETGTLQGEDLLRILRDNKATIPRIVLTAQPDWVPVTRALNYAISEYYVKDTIVAEKVQMDIGDAHKQNLQNFLESFFDLPSKYDFVSDEGRLRFGLKRRDVAELNAKIIGSALCMWQVKARIAAAARSNLPVLITGESGVGKELVAEMIHKHSERGRKNYEWVAVNCAAFNTEMLMSELFGHVKGAFTDARADKRGLLEEANESTLFLDEVGHAEPQLQAALLRALSTGRARRLGSTVEYNFDVRLIAATDQPVFESGKLQSSFVNRLAGIHIHVPPLRERLEDIDEDGLLPHFTSGVVKGKELEFTPAAIMRLRQYSWPGNIRQLKHIVEEAAIEASRMGGTAPRVTVDASQVKWLLDQSMTNLTTPKTSSQPAISSEDIYDFYATDDPMYRNVEKRFSAGYFHYMHEKISNGKRTLTAYEATMRVLNCSLNTLKAKLADYDKLIADELQ